MDRWDGLELEELDADVRQDLRDAAEQLSERLKGDAGLARHYVRFCVDRLYRLLSLPTDKWTWRDVAHIGELLGKLTDIKIVIADWDKREPELAAQFKTLIGRPYKAWEPVDFVLFEQVVKASEG